MSLKDQAAKGKSAPKPDNEAGGKPTPPSPDPTEEVKKRETAERKARESKPSKAPEPEIPAGPKVRHLAVFGRHFGVDAPWRAKK